VNIYVHNSKTPKYMKQKLSEFKGETTIHSHSGTVHTPFLIMNRTNGHKINMETEELNIRNEPPLTNIYSIPHLITTE
jgi:hypothetical protein